MTTSLVRWYHLLLGAGLAAAVLIPWWLLSGEASPENPFRADASVTPLDMPPVPSMAQAITLMPFSAARDPDYQDEASDPAVAVPSSPLPRLVGVVTHGRKAAVALLVGADGNTLLLRGGEAIDGWRVTGISPSAVRLERNGERQSIGLDFKNRTGDAPVPETSP